MLHSPSVIARRSDIIPPPLFASILQASARLSLGFKPLCLAYITPCLAIIHRLQRRCRPLVQLPTRPLRPLLRLVLPDSAVSHISEVIPTTTSTQAQIPPTKISPTILQPPRLLLVPPPSVEAPVLPPAAHARRLRVPLFAAIPLPTAGSLLSPARASCPGSLPRLNQPNPIHLLQT